MNWLIISLALRICLPLSAMLPAAMNAGGSVQRVDGALVEQEQHRAGIGGGDLGFFIGLELSYGGHGNSSCPIFFVNFVTR